MVPVGSLPNIFRYPKASITSVSTNINNVTIKGSLRRHVTVWKGIEVNHVLDIIKEG